ncbi:uncharacterized protein LOC128955379 [Oppia nitens]|uniref:uncharacterized protein LOC128955379 n=1 Tax=Oppia nitens TaxID=1686743 RepID=UPI0023DB026B|nr:uncharacterized protein LOC128955379 [Oppia nitens]
MTNQEYNKSRTISTPTTTTSDLVFNNPYILAKIAARLDIRSLSNVQSVNRHFYNASNYETAKRRDIVHIYLLDDYNASAKTVSPTHRLFYSFRAYTRLWLNTKPMEAIVVIGGYNRSPDYRHKHNSLESLSRYLPKHCRITYLDVGSTVLTSSIRYKSLTNCHINGFNDFDRTAYPCMSSLLLPEIDGIEICRYRDINSVIIDESVKCVLLFQSLKLMRRSGVTFGKASRLTYWALESMIAKFGDNYALGGGTVVAVKSMQQNCPEEDDLCHTLVLTIGGDRVRTGSTVISTTTISFELFYAQLKTFKSRLGFDCDDSRRSTTACFVFSNRRAFGDQLSLALQMTFPSAALFGFQTNEGMFGKEFAATDTDGHQNSRNKTFNEIADTLNKSVIVLVNFQFSKH